MDETTFRILDTLSRQLGRPLSILELTRKIHEFHRIAYYANIYEKLRNLAAHGTITLAKAGKSSIASLNFGDYFLLDLLTEMELIRKRRLLEKRPELQMLCADIDSRCKNLPFIQSISLIRPEKNIKLNKAELLILLHRSSADEKHRLHEIINILQRMHNIRINYLPLSAGEFSELLSSDEANPLKEILSDAVCVFSPQAFWSEILDAHHKGLRIMLREGEADPREVPENELVYNLARLGYKEFGTETKQSGEILKEFLAISLLLRGDARRVKAVPVILAKGRTNWDLLIFLAQKYGASARLLGLLKALNHIKPAREIGEAIATLESMDVKEVKADERGIEDRLRLYNVIR
jgi:hypothetical protein